MKAVDYVQKFPGVKTSAEKNQLFLAVMDELCTFTKTRKVVVDPSSTSIVGSDISVWKEMNQKANKIRRLLGEPEILEEDWFRKLVKNEVLKNPENVRLLHCFDGCGKKFDSYPAFEDWKDFLDWECESK